MADTPLSPRRLAYLTGVRRQKRRIRIWQIALLAGLFGGLCSLGSYGVALWAMTKAPIAMVAALRETSVIFGMLLAVFFLGEKFSAVKLLAVVLVATGIFFMH